MIIGVFLRNIKSYDKTFFIPIVKNNKPYSFFIGENGVGKSSIIEALDIYFNKRREWNINKNSKNKDEVFIAPVHLIKKNELNLKEKELIYLKSISNTLLTWDIDNTNHMKNEWTRSFYNFLIELKELNDLENNYIFIAPLHYSKNIEKFYFIFDKLIKDNIENYDENILRDLIESIKISYSYIYIPVETPIDEVLRMETPEMQQLVKEDILKYTENVLNDKNIQDGRKKINIVDKINHKLEGFMIDINYTINKIDDSYSYSAEGRSKKSLTAVDIREQIFKAFFSIRSLSKNDKSIEKLSSGEKRKALIDIATAFLKQESKRNKKVILAIDEPETSMHMKKIFRQFKQLEDLTINYDVQFIGTTHWYGFLPITDYGNLNHISKEEKLLNIKNFDFFNLFERNDSFPDDIEMKSFFELVTSILTSIKSSEFNKWIICEGSDDKKYLEYYLKYKNLNKNLIILPVSGCGNVRKLYNLLYASLSEKDKVKVKGKILCLIDTDLNFVGLDNSITSDKDKIIFLKRLQLNKNDCTLEKIGNSPLYYQTEVEDCLESNKYYKILKEISKNTDFEDIFTYHTINSNCNISRIKEHNNGATLFEIDDSATGLNIKKFKKFIDFLEDKKTKQTICNKYISEYNSSYIPNWIISIIELLELEEVEIPNNLDINLAEFEDIKCEIEIQENDLENEQIYFNGEISNQFNISQLEEINVNRDYSDVISNDIALDKELINIIEIINGSQQDTLRHSTYIETYIKNNKNNKDLKNFLSSKFIELTKNFTLMKILSEIDIELNFPVLNIIRDISLFKNTNSFYLVLIIVFKNQKNIQDNDLKYIINILNSSEVQNNDSTKNEYYFLIYASLKLNNSDEIKTILSNQSIINTIDSVFTIIYFGHYNKYIKIGNQLKNLIAFSNNILNTKSLQEFYSIFIHALKQYNVFDKLLELDKKKSFMNKLTNYYNNKPKQNNEYNFIFNKIFNNFNIE